VQQEKGRLVIFDISELVEDASPKLKVLRACQPATLYRKHIYRRIPSCGKFRAR
jgi:hypothetical protein